MPLPPAPSKKATILPTSAYANASESKSRKVGSRSRATDAAHPEAKGEAPEALLAIPAAPATPTPVKAPSRRKTASTQVSALLSPPAAAPVAAKSTPSTPTATPVAATPVAAEAPALAAKIIFEYEIFKKNLRLALMYWTEAVILPNQAWA